MNLFTKLQNKISEFKLQINYMKKFPRIVFIGSNNFSLFSLKKLHNKYNIIGIITIPDNYFFKGENAFSPLKKYAINYHIPFMQPKNLLDFYFLKNLKRWNADIQVVVSFRILPQSVWNLPKFGTINFHASLLPQYKGPAPIHWAIINGEKKTGATIFFIEKKIDSGKIILQKEVTIEKEETAGDLEQKIGKISGPMLITSIEKIITKNITKLHPIQSNKNITFKYAPKIFSQDCRIQWEQGSITSICNKIRGLSPYPTAWTLLCLNNTKYYRFKIFLAKKIQKKHNLSIGIILFSRDNMMISVKNGFISVIIGQIEGRKKMNVKNLINGININARKNSFVE
ncbi:methionyl-tRNA formyltransferase [Blattabacterium cuenoti]|uniref:methionyl-tRNA formyltransferase n=1 Tax=Blattabacterium cuenoti TaxID=1653831 RepID=UPI001EECC43E|nr:methionyl-tRNA formyltransferase [Blattabacterium cuenoti]